MTLSIELRKDIRKKLRNISERQLRNRVNQMAVKSGIPNKDVAGLALAHELGITVEKPMYKAKPEALAGLERYLERKGASIQVVTPSVGRQGRAKSSVITKRIPRFLNFGERYPAVFYKRLELEIDLAVAYGDIPSAAFVLCRKLVENLLYNLLQAKYGGRQIMKYFDTRNRRPLDFSVLISNLRDSKADFDLDQHTRIEKFLTLVHPFRDNANSKAHNLLEYAESTKEVRKAKVPEMADLLLGLIEELRDRDSSHR